MRKLKGPKKHLLFREDGPISHQGTGLGLCYTHGQVVLDKDDVTCKNCIKKMDID